VSSRLCNDGLLLGSGRLARPRIGVSRVEAVFAPSGRSAASSTGMPLDSASASAERAQAFVQRDSPAPGAGTAARRRRLTLVATFLPRAAVAGLMQRLVLLAIEKHRLCQWHRHADMLPGRQRPCLART